MKGLLSAFAAGIALFAIHPHIAMARDIAPLSAYGALPDVEDAAISPDGNNIAIMATVHGRRIILIRGPDNTVLRTFAVDDLKVRDFQWLDNDRLLMRTSQTEDLWGFTTDKIERSNISIVPVVQNGEPQLIFGKDREIIKAVFGNYGVREVAGQKRGYYGGLKMRRDRDGTYVFDHGRPYLFEVDLNQNKAREIASAPGSGVDREWLVDANGQVAATFDLATNDGDWKLRGADGSVLTQGNQSAGYAGLVGLGYGGATVIYSVRNEEGIAERFEIPLSGGPAKPFLKDADIERLYWDKITDNLIGYVDENTGPMFENPTHQRAVEKIRKAFAKFDMRMMDWTPGFEKVIVRTSGNGDSGSWYVVDLSTMRADGFAWERIAIEPEMVGPISTVAYTATDGLELDGILTLPPDTEAKNLPVIIFPHGGPHSSDKEAFDWWAQAFASRGYAVFQPNFRGSTNRDQAFKLAGYGEWGRKMQTDLSDGLAALAEKGIVDPSRACIMGASYGGYAALAGVTLQNGLYRCAVAFAPVTDLQAMYREDYRASGGQRITKKALLLQLGPMDGWSAVSPQRHADQANAPILLIHGRDDTVVPYDHSRKMADALKDAKKPHELIALDGEDHWLSSSATRQQMLEAAVRFIERHNPPD